MKRVVSFFLRGCLILGIVLATTLPLPTPTWAADVNLRGYWALDGNANDSSGYGNNGTLTGGSWSTSHAPTSFANSGSLSLNGSSGQGIQTPLVTTASNNVSLSAWVNWAGTNSSGQMVLYNGDSGPNGYGIYIQSSGELSILNGGVAVVSSPISFQLTAGVWQYVVIMRDAGVWKLYVDGSLVPLNGNPSPNAPTNGGTIGRAYAVAGNTFNGLIDEARIYDRVLASTETCSPAITVTNANDSGAGSLRQAIAGLCSGGTITFNNNYTITLSSELAFGKSMTIDGVGHNVTVSGNHVTRVFNLTGGTITLNQLTIADGYFVDGSYSGVSGAGIRVTGATLYLTNSTVSGNVTGWPGGGGMELLSGTANVNNSTFIGNSGNYGGGIDTHSSTTLNVTNSTFSGNSADSAGGALSVGGVGNIINSTISGNSAAWAGGGGGINNEDGAVTVSNSIIANNPTGGNCFNHYPEFSLIVGVNSLANDSSCGAGFINSSSILLGTLGNYGGTTLTFPLLPGSLAIDAGDDAICTSAPVNNLDQRGIVRPHGAHCDIGAFESQGFSLAVGSGNNQSTAINTAFTTPLSVTVTANNAIEPINSGVVTFVGPLTGASTNPITNTATIASSVGSRSVTANGTAGSYNVTASARGATSVTFALTNQSPCAPHITVANNADSGAGSLRQAIADVCAGGTIDFDPTLSGQTITLTSGQLPIGKSVTIDGLTTTPGVFVSGNNAVRVFYVSAGTVTINNLTLQNGRNVPVIPGNIGGAGLFVDTGTAVTLNNCAVLDNATNASPTVGGGIVVNTGASLTMNNCTVSGNSSTFDGGGILNLGTLNVNNSTIVNNTTPGGGGGLETINNTTTLRNTILAGNSGSVGADCYTPAGVIQSAGYNMVGSTFNCAIAPNASDVKGFSYASLLLGSLQNNVGPNSTYALLPGSPAIDAIPGCNGAPATDQRGISRPQGVACDVGAYERQSLSASTTTLTSSPNPSTYGQSVTFTATVTSVSGTPTGNVQFYADGSAFGAPINLSGGQTTTSTAALITGTHILTVTYSGDATYAASTSSNYTQTVKGFDLSVRPASLWARLGPNLTATQELSICNAGIVSLTWKLSEWAGGGTPGAASIPLRLAAPARSDQASAFPRIAAKNQVASNLVLIIEDDLPWYRYSTQNILTANGIAYDQVGSAQLGTVDLTPYALVIVGSAQSNAFYTAWNANFARFEAYVASGGALWLGTATSTPGLTNPLLPSGVVLYDDVYAQYGNVATPGHPWVAGISNPFAGLWLSHGEFSNLYSGSIVVATSANTGQPTLVDYRYGAGRVLITSLTLEIGWDYGWSEAPILQNSLLDLFNWGVNGDVPWLSETPLDGTVAAGACTTSTVTFDSTGRTPGDYVADLFISSGQPTITVPVTMTVLQPADILTVTYTITNLQVAFNATTIGEPPLTYAWDFGDSGTSNVGDPTHTYATGGSYAVTLTLSNIFATDVWTGTVSVCDPVRAADFAWLPSAPRPGETVAFSATTPLGTPPFTYAWDWGDGTGSGSGQSATHAFAAPEVYSVTLTVTNTCGAVVAQHPVLAVDLVVTNNSPTTLGHGTSLSATLLPAGNVTYQWNAGDGTLLDGQFITHTYPMAGQYTAIVTATRAAGTGIPTTTLTGTTTVTITNQPPVANAGTDQSVSVNMLVTLDGTGSTDPDGHLPLTYGWTQTGGSVVTFTPNVSVTTFTAPSTPAVLTFTLIVTDAFDARSTPAIVTVRVGDQAIADLSASNNSPTRLGNFTSFTATIGAGSNVLYTWNFGDGQTAHGAQVNHRYANIGTYTATVTATNSAGSISTTTSVAIERATLYLPLVSNQYVAAPDLVVERLSAASNQVQVIIKNQGNAPVTDEFWVDVYISPAQAPTQVNQAWSMLGQQGLVWGVTTQALSALTPGGVITLTLNDAYYRADLSQLTGPLAAGTVLYAQVDSYDATTSYGAVLETHEILGLPYTNILGPVMSTAGKVTLSPPDLSSRTRQAATHLPDRP